MARINHVASYFMPLFCSDKPHVVSITVLATIITFTLFYLPSRLLLSEYDDPLMFKPVAQDYFRTALLGLFSPFLYYFIKVFLLNINGTFVIGNLVADFFINDWFMLCLLIMLAYPQLQEPSELLQPTLQFTQHDNSMEQWHIIPRQSYIFGISWALGELTICIITNLFNYQEATDLDSDALLDIAKSNDEINNSINPNHPLNRNEITLAKCVGLRRLSSTISSNVYYNEIEPLTQFGHNYGTIKGDNKLNSSGSSKGKEVPKVVMVDPMDNSLRFSSTDVEEGLFQRDLPKPILEHRYGFTWIKYMSTQVPVSTLSSVKLYTELNSWKSITWQLVQYVVLLSSSILLIAGQSFLLSIYFIYVRGHERLFTKTVNYFGSKEIEMFLLFLVTPLILINFCMSIFVFLCNDVLEWVNVKVVTEGIADIEYAYYPAIYQNQNAYLHESTSSQSLDLNNSQLSTAIYPSFGQEFNDISTMEKASRWKFTKYFKKLVREWKGWATHDLFILISVIIWSSVMFIAGLVSAVKLQSLNN
ncbi:hypothetical protein MOSE0_M07008 [Monosporozyma servazzii]